ncbi:LysE family transporter [Rothia sp. AR01]|uniref:LysE family transporter n=1 Tax=Rothia santali TaxID=2949643 RepID=A0A9X2HI81_9MICC|nr:LysE family transporter [Rothia santali]MCP3426181.1 LysE family transporter [Rothia santali]
MVAELPLILMGAGTTLALIVAIGAQNAFILKQGIMGRTILPVIVFCALADVLLYAVGVSGMGFLVERTPWVLTVLKWGGVAFLLGYGAMAARRAIRPSGEALVVPREAAGRGAGAVADGVGGAVADAPAGGTRGTTADGARGASADGGRGTATGVLDRVEAPAASAGAAPVPAGEATPGGAGPGPRRGPRRRELTAALLTCAAITFLNPHTYLDTVVLVGSVANQHGEDGRWWFFVGSCLGSAVWFVALGYGARLLRPLFARPLTWRLLDAGIAVLMLFIAGNLILH